MQDFRPSAKQQTFLITEHDAAGALLTTYVSSESVDLGSEAASRVDVVVGLPLNLTEPSTVAFHLICNSTDAYNPSMDIVSLLHSMAWHPPSPRDAKPAWQRLADVFLPSGYPHSVTEDYTAYQIYDSLQAFVSSVAGLLSSRAVLEGIGVGDSDQSPTTALLLTTLLPSTASRLSTIVFAHKLGLALEPECKMYRLLADLFNDAAMVIDLLSPILPSTRIRMLALGLSAVLRALCGVAAGSSKASLSQHFAKWGNLGEVNAKDSSQETVVSLVGTLFGSLVVSRITSPGATWLALIVLLVLHLAFNYLAVRSVSLHTLNRQRATLVFGHFIAHRAVLSPSQVSAREHIFYRFGGLSVASGPSIGHCRIGMPLAEVLRCICIRQGSHSMLCRQDIGLEDLLRVFEGQRYILWWSRAERRAVITVRKGAGAKDLLKAWYHALLLATEYHEMSVRIVEQDAKPRLEEVQVAESNVAQKVLQSDMSTKGRITEDGAADHVARELDHVVATLSKINESFHGLCQDLARVGWDLDGMALETGSGTRLDCGSETK